MSDVRVGDTGVKEHWDNRASLSALSVVPSLKTSEEPVSFCTREVSAVGIADVLSLEIHVKTRPSRVQTTTL